MAACRRVYLERLKGPGLRSTTKNQETQSRPKHRSKAAENQLEKRKHVLREPTFPGSLETKHKLPFQNIRGGRKTTLFEKIVGPENGPVL